MHQPQNNNIIEGSVNLALLQNSGHISNLVLFYTQRGQRLPLPVSDVREMVFGSLPTTDIEATKLHILPAGILNATGGVTDRPLVTLTKLFTFRIQTTSGSPSSSSSQSLPQQTQKRYVMALVLLIQPKVSKTSERVTEEEYQKVKIFISRHFMTLDLRMCKAARKVRNHVMKLSEIGAQASSSGSLRSIPQINLKQQKLSHSQIPISSSAGMRGTNFIIALQNDPEIAQEIDTLKNNIQTLLYGPKIEHPIWLGIVGWSSMHKYFVKAESKGKRIFATNSPEAVIFLNRLCDLEQYNTPRWNNFVAAAVTAVLSTHKAWVGTVSTEVSDEAIQEASHRQMHIYGGSSIFRNYIDKQLSDLLGGSLGGPLARAAIVGKNVPVIEALLDVLSFFMRSQSFLINTTSMKNTVQSDPAHPNANCHPLDNRDPVLSSLSSTPTSTSSISPSSSSSASAIPGSPNSPQSISSLNQDILFGSPQNSLQSSLQSSLQGSLANMSHLVPGSGNGNMQAQVANSVPQKQVDDVKSLPGGASLNVVPIEDRNEYPTDIRVMASSAEGPARALYGGVHEHFQPDLALMGVTEPYERVLDALYEELQFEQELYSEYLGPGDTPVAVLGDFAARVFELVTIVPPEDDELDGPQSSPSTPSQVKATLESPKKESGKKSKKKIQTLDSSYRNERYMKTAGMPQAQRQGMRRSTIFPSTHVLNTLETAKSLWKLGISADTCIMHIEDRLHEIVSMAKVLMEYLRILPSVPSREQVESELQLGPGDLSLIASLVQGSKKWPLV